MKKTIVLDEYSYYCNDNNTLVKYNYHFENDEDVYLGYVKTVDPSVSILGITIDSSKEEVIEIFNVYGYIVTEEKTSFREKVIGYKDNITITYSINYRGDIELSCEISDYLDNEIFYTEPVQKVLFYDVFLVLLSRLYTLIVGLIIMYLGKRSRSNVQFFNFRFK